jgi:predicted RecB family nuclease
MLITEEILLYYQRCQRRSFLEVYGKNFQKSPISDFQIRLQQQRLSYQQSVIEKQINNGIPTPTQPTYRKGDWKTGAKSTLALMQEGVERIEHGVLLYHVDDQITLSSHPDLLIKQPGESYFGDWVYSPLDIYYSKRPKQEYKILMAFHIQLLSYIQGSWSEKAWMILRDKEVYEVDLWKTMIEMQSILNECMQMLSNKQPPDLFISRQLCSFCPWLKDCYDVAKSQNHLSLLPGVTPSRYKYLHSLNINTLEDLAQTNPLYLQPELDGKIAEQVVRQAQSVLYNQVIFIPDTDHSLPSANIELFFDIEAQPDLNLDYLLGVVVVDHVNKTQIFYPCLAEEQAQEETIWNDFLTLIEKYPNAPIYHFSPYEYDTIKRLAKLYKTPQNRLTPILKRLVDIYQKILSSVTLPVEGYSLKAIATSLGFQWRNQEGNGSQCICWYDSWLKTGDRQYLDLILQYNEDDCLATLYVKNWLAQQ